MSPEITFLPLLITSLALSAVFLMLLALEAGFPLRQRSRPRRRRLDTKTYECKCSTCMWGCLMPVEIIVDHWNPSKKKYRFEAFCYGPKSCPLYRAGATRKVPGRAGMTWEEEDWVDEDATSLRGPDN